VGASIIAHGSSHRGSTSSAVEWGHTTVIAGGRTCRCGARGCLEAYAGGEAILAAYGEPLPDTSQLPGTELPLGTDQESALAALIALAPGSERATEVLDQAAFCLGVSIGNLINLFNPERIIIGGWAGLLLGERMLPAIAAAAREHSLRYPFARTSIELGRLGPDAVALGAATLPIEALLGGTALAAPRSARPAS
jgi:predicted NBD/HSP70 family sugar kinase